MKKVIILALVTVLYINASAQQGFRIGAGLSVAAPVSNLDAYSIGVGVDVLGQYGLSDKFAITADVGYTTLFTKAKNGNSLNIIPIRGGVRFYPTSQIYLGAKAGLGIITQKNMNNQSNLAFGIGAGFKMDQKLDIGIAYEGVSFTTPAFGLTPANNASLGYISVRLGYFFN